MSNYASQEKMLSDMAAAREAKFAKDNGFSIDELRAFQRRCLHLHRQRGTYVDTCLICDAAVEQSLPKDYYTGPAY